MLKHGILGLLNYGDMTGYEIREAFESSLKFFWPAQTSQIYSELIVLEKGFCFINSFNELQKAFLSAKNFLHATFELVEEVRAVVEKYYPGEWYLAGEGVSTYDLMDTITADMVKVNLVAIGAVFLVLFLTLKSAVLPIILVLSIETAIWINLSIPYFADSTIFYIAYLIISSIQLGATVDYAILFTDRYKEKMRKL